MISSSSHYRATYDRRDQGGVDILSQEGESETLRSLDGFGLLHAWPRGVCDTCHD